MLGLLLAAALANPLPTNYPDCAKYFHDACSEALAAWLPTYALRPDSRDRASRTSEQDDFVYEGKSLRSDYPIELQGPRDGTFLVYGSAGPPRGRVVYDSVHHVAFYSVGCCAWREYALGYVASPPPKVVANRDLTGVRTVRGIRLDMSPAQVEAIYGASTLRTVAKAPHVFALSYKTGLKMAATIHAPCEQNVDFFFRAERLILISLGDGC